MKRVILYFLIGMICITTSGCSDSAKDRFETAQFEELQKNFTHARKIYKEIIFEDPGSEYAKKAKERLDGIKDKE